MSIGTNRILRTILAISFLSVCLSDINVLVADEASAAARAGEILDVTGIQGGIVVHLGCGDGKLTFALQAGGNFTVHGLDSDAANVEAARRYIAAKRRYGFVSVERLTGKTLPYGNDLVNLVVDEDGTVPEKEIMRVLSPGGVAYFYRDGKATKVVKPRPGDIDEWSHFLHDAGNNAVA